jgi:hypothetical protein
LFAQEACLNCQNENCEGEISFRVRTAEDEKLECTECALKDMREGAFIIEITDDERQAMG